MSDERLTELERRWKETGAVEDEAAYLLERVRVGELDHDRLRLAAYLEHPAATVAAGAQQQDDWVRGLEPDERRAAARLVLLERVEEELPGWLKVSENAPCRITAVHVTYQSVDDAWVRRYSCLTDLVSFYLDGSAVTDEGLAHVARLEGLRYLNLRSTKVTDEGLRHLRALNRLESLWLNDTKVQGPGLKHLQALSNLKQLFLDGTGVDDSSLRYLEGLPKLEYLTLTSTRVTNEGLKSLRRIKKLSYVDAANTGVSEGVTLPRGEVDTYYY